MPHHYTINKKFHKKEVYLPGPDCHAYKFSRKIIIFPHKSLNEDTSKLHTHSVLRARIICLMKMHPGSGPGHK